MYGMNQGMNARNGPRNASSNAPSMLPTTSRSCCCLWRRSWRRCSGYCCCNSDSYRFRLNLLKTSYELAITYSGDSL